MRTDTALRKSYGEGASERRGEVAFDRTASLDRARPHLWLVFGREFFMAGEDCQLRTWRVIARDLLHETNPIRIGELLVELSSALEQDQTHREPLKVQPTRVP
jgi:hypothetical protein